MFYILKSIYCIQLDIYNYQAQFALFIHMQSILSSVPKTIYIKYCIKFNFSPHEKSENRIYKGNSFLCVNFGSRYWCTRERSPVLLLNVVALQPLLKPLKFCIKQYLFPKLMSVLKLFKIYIPFV